MKSFSLLLLILCISINIAFSQYPSDSCNCSGGKWGSVTLTQPGLKPQTLKCSSENMLKCNTRYTLNSVYYCADKNCTKPVNYYIKDPSGLTSGGNLPLSFTPQKTGIYTLVLRGWCGNHLCDSCTIKFIVDCPDTCSCKGGRWKPTTITPKEGKKFIVECNSAPALKCNMPYTINSQFVCVGIKCNEHVKYQLKDPAGIVRTGVLPLSLIPSKSGIYILVMYGMCGDKQCSKCTIKLRVRCK